MLPLLLLVPFRISNYNPHQTAPLWDSPNIALEMPAELPSLRTVDDSTTEVPENEWLEGNDGFQVCQNPKR